MGYIKNSEFITKPFYHIYNKTIDHKNVFTDDLISTKFLQVFNYYKYTHADIKYSRFVELPLSMQNSYTKTHFAKQFQGIDLLAFCEMPNHYHLLVQELSEGYLSKFLSDFINSFTKYYNILNKRMGPLFVGSTKKTFIQNESQLLHTFRYIHLNPTSSSILSSYSDLENYKKCSHFEYINKATHCNTKKLLHLFSGKEDYKEFIYGRVTYQKQLEILKKEEKYLLKL